MINFFKKVSKVSIIVPIYNSEKTLSKCLESLINQTYTNLEIICINDCSTDNSLSILKLYELQDDRIKLINNLKNLGIAKTRNIGLDNVTGKYIMWCDSDDYYEKNMCELMVKSIKKADIACCETNILFSKSLKFTLLTEYLKYVLHIFYDGYRKINEDFFLNMKNRVLWNKIFKSKIIKKYNIRFANVAHSEDLGFVLKYLSVSKDAYSIKDPLYNYTRSEKGSISKFIENRGIDGINAFIDASNFIHKNSKKLFFKAMDKIILGEKSYIFIRNRKVRNLNLKLLHKELHVKKTQKILNISENKKISKDTIHIVLCCNKNNLEQLTVTICSIIKNKDKSDLIKIHIICESSILNNCKKILTKYGNIIKYYKVLPKQKKEVIYTRYLIFSLLKNLDKVLYIEPGSIILKSLQNLYSKNIDDNYAAVIEDTNYKERNNIKEFLLIDNYFNSDVMLLNLKKINANKLNDLFSSISKNLNNLLDNHIQDIFNIMFNNKIVFIEPFYNIQYEIFENSKSYSVYKEITIEDIKNNQTIMTFSRNKPWEFDANKYWHPYWYKYFEYLKISPLKQNIKLYKNKIF